MRAGTPANDIKKTSTSSSSLAESSSRLSTFASRRPNPMAMPVSSSHQSGQLLVTVTGSSSGSGSAPASNTKSQSQSEGSDSHMFGGNYEKGEFARRVGETSEKVSLEEVQGPAGEQSARPTNKMTLTKTNPTNQSKVNQSRQQQVPPVMPAKHEASKGTSGVQDTEATSVGQHQARANRARVSPAAAPKQQKGFNCSGISSGRAKKNQKNTNNKENPTKGKNNNNLSARSANLEAQMKSKSMALVAAAAEAQAEAEADASELHYDEHRKQNHCEIEKRRRDKMNQYITELASILPALSSLEKYNKLDKLTVLRMAVQHVKSLRSSLCSFSSFHLRPSFLSSGNLLKNLILQMASQEAQDNLFMVVTCDRGKVLFASQSSKDILNQDQSDLVGQCLFDILHKDDVSKVKEQISHFNLMPKEMLVDSKTFQPIKQSHIRNSFASLQSQANSTPEPGARRSFFCRMKSGRNETNSSQYRQTQTQNQTNLDSKQLKTQQVNNQKHKPIAPDRQLPTVARSNRETSRADTVNGPSVTVVASKPANSPSSSEPQLKKTQNHIENNAKSTNENPTLSNMNINDMTSETKTPDHSDKQLKPSVKINNHPNSDGASSSGLGICKFNKTCESGENSTKADGNGSDSGSSSDTNSISSSDGGASSSSGIESSSSREVNELSKNGQANGNIRAKLASGIGPSKSTTNINETKQTSNSVIDVATSKQRDSQTSNSASGTNSAVGQQRVQSSKGTSKKQMRYIVMHCTGYLKSITLRQEDLDDEDEFDDYLSETNTTDGDQSCASSKTINCLVAVCRRSPMDRDLKPDRPLTFTCRYSMEGKFVFVDQRTTIALGYTPQQLLGTSHYAYCHKDSVNTFKECHRQSILKSEPVSSDIYQFKRANGQHLWLQTSLKSFRNPWTKFIDYIVANHTTAEGSDRHYNEGCVPTKFNQDMTGGEASQSASPASSSSLPSVDSKKSLSPSSSSNGSSYSMDSYASGGSIQALLNHIDKVKSGGVKHAPDLRIRRDKDHEHKNSSGGSTRKSNEDSGNYSDLQSCSSISSQNSATINNDYLNVQNINGTYGNSQNTITEVVTDQTSSQQIRQMNPSQTQTNQNIVIGNMNGTYSQKHLKTNYRPPPSTETNSSSTATQTDNQVPNECRIQNEFQTEQQNFNPVRNSNNQNYRTPEAGGQLPATKCGPRMAITRMVLPLDTMTRPHQRLYGNQYLYRGKGVNSTPSQETVTCDQWTGAPNTMYSPAASGPHLASSQVGSGLKNGMNCELDNRNQQPSNYMLHQRLSTDHQVNQLAHTEFMKSQIPMTNQQPIEGPVGGQYSTGALIPVNNYMDTRYAPRMGPQQQQPQQIQQESPMEAPMIWNSSGSTGNNNIVDPNLRYHSQNVAPMQQVCSGANVNGLMNQEVNNSNQQQMMTQQLVTCQQCANHKCSNQQQMMMNPNPSGALTSSSNTDLNSINLTSLAVDGDLDEDQLLEYLADCDPEAQLYHIQNNSYLQYNIYR